MPANQDDEKSLDLTNQLVQAYKEANLELMERVSIIKSSYTEAAKEHELIKQVQQETEKAIKSKKLLLLLEEELAEGTTKSSDIEKEREKILDRIKHLTADKSLAEQASNKAQKDGLKEESELYQDIVKEIEESIDKLEKMEAAAKGVEDQAKKLESKKGTDFWTALDDAFGTKGKGKADGFFGKLKQGFSDAAKASKKIAFDQDQAKAAGVERKNIEFDKRMGANAKDPAKRGRFRDKTTGRLVKGDKVKALDAKIAKGGGGLAKRLMGALTKVFAKMAPMLMKALGPIGIIASILVEIWQAMMKVDAELVEMSKSMNMSKTAAASMRMDMSSAALRSGDMFVTTTKMVKAQSTLNKELDLAVSFTGEMLVKATQLLEKVKLTGAAVAGLAGQTIVSGGAMKDNYKNALLLSHEMQRGARIPLDLRKVLEAVGKTQGVIRAQLKGSTEQITSAVTQAKLLGMELKDVAAAGRTMLDFESSIKAELEAELLLGKQLNLEKARLAALTGDYETLTKEIAKNAGDWTSFTNMNVLQQEALAKSLGMQADQLSDILFKQETQNKTARELRAMGKEDLAARLEQTTAQDKFNAAMDKLKSLLADIVTPLIPLLDMVMSILNPLFELLAFMEPSLRATALIITSIVDSIRYIAGGFGLWGPSASEAYEGTGAAWEGYKGSVQNVGNKLGIGSGDTMGGSSMRSYQHEGIAMTPQIATLAEKKPEVVMNADRFENMLGSKELIAAFKENQTNFTVQNKFVYDSHNDANYYNGPRGREKSGAGIYA